MAAVVVAVVECVEMPFAVVRVEAFRDGCSRGFGGLQDDGRNTAAKHSMTGETQIRK